MGGGVPGREAVEVDPVGRVDVIEGGIDIAAARRKEANSKERVEIVGKLRAM